MFAFLKTKKEKNKGIDILIKQLQKANEIPSINKGGCALVAHAGYHSIKKINPDIDVKIIYIVRNHDTEMISNLKKNKPDSCSHAVLKINGLYYDSDEFGITKEKINTFNRYKLLKVKPNICYESIVNENNWNSRFDREEHAKKISEIFDVEFDYSYQHSS